MKIENIIASMLIKFKSINKQIIHLTPTLTLICTTPNNLILAQLFQFNHTPTNPKRMVPQNYRFQTNNRNNTFDQNRGSYQEFRINLIQGQQNNTMNQSQHPSGRSGSVPNQSQKRVRESNSGQSRMQVDENYQQNK